MVSHVIALIVAESSRGIVRHPGRSPMACVRTPRDFIYLGNRGESRDSTWESAGSLSASLVQYRGISWGSPRELAQEEVSSNLDRSFLG